MKKNSLKNLLSPWITNIPDKNINNLAVDSRKTHAGDLFIFIKNNNKNRNNFFIEAITKKVIAILSETNNPKKHGQWYYQKNVLIISFFKLSKYVSALSGKFYNSPGKNLTIIGVTGTNGKTTVTHLITQWGQILGDKTAIMGTLGNGFDNNALKETKNTTSSAIEIQSFLQLALIKNIKIVAIEVSSHGLIQNRVKDVPFSIAVLTNVTQDHLDYHKTIEKYQAAKWSFFAKHTVKKIVLNANDTIGKIWLKKLAHCYIIAVTINDSTQKKYSHKWINATKIKYDVDFMHITFESSWGNDTFSSVLIGTFNVINILIALACLLELGYDLSILMLTSKKLRPIHGRMQTFQTFKKTIVIIDYAHTPDALKNTLKTIRSYYKNKKIWCIFGCGGERDKRKRCLMGSIAEKIADQVIITNDNPRTESAMQIVQDIISGCIHKTHIKIILDRKKAISFACSKTSSNDVILIAGKGHETKQIFGNQQIDYSDEKTVLNLLETK